MKPIFEMFVEYKVTDKNGKVITQKHKKAHSFLIQFLQQVACLLNHANTVLGDTIIIKDTSNANENVRGYSAPQSWAFLAGEAVATDDEYGILVGTGTGAVANTNYALGTKIAHGVAATQLQYGNTTVNEPSEVGANVDCTITRAFVNGSGTSITVQETGIAVSTNNSADAERYFQIIRDLTGGVAVADGQTLTVTYTLRTTV